jgi:hypothetical protein
MACEPNFRVWIELGDIRVEIQYCSVVSILVSKRSLEAGLVASIGAQVAVASLSLSPWTSSSTTTPEKQIVVFLVISCCLSSIKNGYAGAFNGHDDGRVAGICKDVSPESILLPPEAGRMIEYLSNIPPFSCAWLDDIGIGRDCG